MPLSAVGIGGLLLTALAILDDDVDQSLSDDLLPLIGLVVLWFDLASSTPGSLEDGNNDETVFCRGPYMPSKSIDTLPAMLQHESEKWIQTFLRCTHQSFSLVCDLIRDHPVFQSTGNKPQRPVEIQLATFLRAYGGTRKHHLDGAPLSCNVSEGTTFLYIDRVVEALGDLAGEYIRWPDETRRTDIRSAFAEMGFPGAIGAIDGLLIQFAERPLTDAIYYYCRVKFYGANVQATVDHEGYFTSYDIGWPASVTDIQVFKRSKIWSERAAHFHADEYLLADKGYEVTPFTVRPFDDNELSFGAERQQRVKFNRCHASARIVIEQTFGLLKGRFPALKLLPGRDIPRMYKVIQALIILHNIFLMIGDNAREIPDFDGADADAEAIEAELGAHANGAQDPVQFFTGSASSRDCRLIEERWMATLA